MTKGYTNTTYDDGDTLRERITNPFWDKARHVSGTHNGGADEWIITKSDFDAYVDSLLRLVEAETDKGVESFSRRVSSRIDTEILSAFNQEQVGQYDLGKVGEADFEGLARGWLNVAASGAQKAKAILKEEQDKNTPSLTKAQLKETE